MGIESVINGGISFAAVLVLMVLNIPIGIAMLVVGFVGFALISGFDPAPKPLVTFKPSCILVPAFELLRA